MAEPGLDLDPSEAPTRPGGMGGLADQWRGFMQDPANRAFMLSAGLSMMQPRGSGQTTIGHMAQSFGAGAEAARNVQAGEEGRQERESVQRAREAGSEAKLDLAAAAQQRAGASQMNAETRALAGSLASPNAALGAEARAMTAFQRWIQNESLLDPTGAKDPFLPTLGVKDKAEAVQKFSTDPAFRAKVIQLFGATGGAQGTTAPGPGLPTAPGTVPPPDHPNAQWMMNPRTRQPGWFIKDQTGRYYEVR